MNAILKMAGRNVWKNWRHSLAALLSISIGFIAMGLFQGYIAHLEHHFGDVFREVLMLGDVIVERRGAQDAGREDPWGYMLKPADQLVIDDYLAKSQEVAGRVRFLDVSGMISNGKNSAVFVGYGHDVAGGVEVRGRSAWNVVAGKPLHLAAPDAPVVLVGRALSRVLDCTHDENARLLDDDGHPVAAERPFKCKKTRVQLATTTQRGQINAVDPEIAGITDGGVKELDLRLVAMPLPLAQTLTDTKDVSRYTVRLKDPGRAEAFAADLMAQAKARGLDVDARPWREHPVGDLYRRSLEFLTTFRTLVLFIVLVIAGMSVFNTMTKAVDERVREIGSLRSIGFRRRDVVALFTIEAALLAVVAVALGFALVLPLTAGIKLLGIRYSAGLFAQGVLLRVGIVPAVYVVVAVGLMIIASVAAYFPARRAAAMRIPDALGHT